MNLEDLIRRNLPSLTELYVLSVDEGGKPPRLEAVAYAYQSVAIDLHWSWQLAELTEFCLSDKIRTEQVKERLNWLNRLDDTETGLPFVLNPYAFEPLELVESMHSQPVARVTEAHHSNPLETLITVSAGALVLVIAGTIWAIRSWRQYELDRNIVAARAEVLRSIAKTIEHGSTKRIEAIMPIAKGIWNEGISKPSTDQELNINVAKAINARVST